MLWLYVENIHTWHKKIEHLYRQNNYGEHAKIFSTPHEDEYGSLIMNIADPSGVLSHIYQGA